MKKRYIVYIEVPDDHIHIEYKRTCFYITAWLLTKEIKHIYYDNGLYTAIYDRKKGDVIYEK